jgi:hypothetical protein
MRVTIVSCGSKVLVDGLVRTIDMTGIDPQIHAIQWHDTLGEIEFVYDFFTNSQRPNVRFTDLSPYQVFIDRWTAAAPSTTIQSTSIIISS